MYDFVKWADVKGDFTETAILGNGASIAVDNSKFDYKSLYNAAKSEGRLETSTQQVFEYLNTSDFELVLRMLWHATKINSALEITEERTEKAYLNLRSALIETVRVNHPSYSPSNQSLNEIYHFLAPFNTVISLNYDLLIYWAIMLGNEVLGQHFKDCFLSGSFEHSWERLREPLGSADGSTLLFYPHGNLVLTTDLFGFEEKISRDVHAELLNSIFDDWESGNAIPLFVAEGLSSQKKRAINRSAYLSEVYYGVMPKISGNILVYGWSFDANDNHILEALNMQNIERMCISIFTGEEHYERCIVDIKRKLEDNDFDPQNACFVKYDDEKLWIY